MSSSGSRRRFLKGTAASALLATAPAAPAAKLDAPGYAALGLKPVINCVGTVTYLGGSIMPPEVVQAMVEASRYFVPIAELQKKAGERIASLIGVPGAMVTCGAASAITVATAAAMTRGDRGKVGRLPDTAGMPYEVVVQKAHRFGYEAQVLLTGAKLVWVESAAEAERAVTDRTAMMFFLNKGEPDGQVKRQEWNAIAKRRGVPSFNDAAADTPPVTSLRSNVVDDGFDMVAFSGGKGLLGPQASGLLLGRKDLIDAGMLCISPNGGVGRGMKVGKEEIMGLVAAVERFLKTDHAAEMKKLHARADHVIAALKGINGLSVRKDIPPIANVVPHVVLEWQAGASAKLPKGSEVIQRLGENDPPIVVLGSDKAITFSMWMLQGDEHKLVAARLKEIFSKA